MAIRIARPQTAFANGAAKGRKKSRVKDKKHLDWIRSLPCIVSGRVSVEAAHISYADASYGKRERGKGEKAGDCWVVPLSPEFHAEQHRGSEREFWRRHGIDPLKVAMALYLCSGDDDQAMVILREAWGAAHARRRFLRPPPLGVEDMDYGD